jgi:hypothetical protein
LESFALNLSILITGPSFLCPVDDPAPQRFPSIQPIDGSSFREKIK